MEEEKLRYRIGANIAVYRKRANLTQAGLAAKLNYSDKAVSKWERGESMPDVLTLAQLAEQFEITVNDLMVDPDEVPEENETAGETTEAVVVRKPKRKADKNVIQMLASVLVWFVALLVFVVLSSVNVPKSWVSFFYAIPVNAIVLLSLRSAWRRFNWNQILISVIVWGSLLSVYITLLVFAGANVWRVFLLGIPGQIAIYLWFRMFYTVREAE